MTGSPAAPAAPMAPTMIASSICFTLCILLGVFQSSIAAPLFYESFEDPWEGRWFLSSKDEYTGIWKQENSEGHEDLGLVASERQMKYGIAIAFSQPIELDRSKPIILQYDVRLQKGLMCGGAYMKFLMPQKSGWTPDKFDSETPYSFMLGPDKCNRTNMIHFIFSHKSLKTGDLLQHHLKFPPRTVEDKFSHAYTAIIYPNDTLHILVDGELKRRTNLLSSEFKPSVIPPKTIPDPNDKKPEDWDERIFIIDPEAKKPSTWDEDAPQYVEDMSAVKPKEWLEDEPIMIEDPNAEKPEEWDDEVDGPWKLMVQNPKCAKAVGCGKWVRPLKLNPNYKGKWKGSAVQNPNYKGKYVQRWIPNPDYIEYDKDHAELQPIAGVGIDILTMQEGILFDNILISNDEEEAQEFREKTWRPKFNLEKRLDDRHMATKIFDGFKWLFFEFLRASTDASFLVSYKPTLVKWINKVERNLYLSRGIFLSIVIVWNTMLYKLLCCKKGSKKKAPKKSSKKDASHSGNVTKESKDGVERDSPESINEQSTEMEAKGVPTETSRARHRWVSKENSQT